ncbi:MAG: hypothetical protein EBR82_11940 [Caulobacteraceae bacterium]|nr:hypothetical protein [Caulobacteraceae bacterium]
MNYCIECHLKKRREQHAKNKDSVNQARRNAYAENKNGIKDWHLKYRRDRYQRIGRERLKQWEAANKEKLKLAHRNKQARYREWMTDSYIKKILSQHNNSIAKAEYPQELIEVKRLQLMIERLCNEKRKRVT